MVQFVPLSFRPGREADLQEIEEVNGVEVGGILKARWIKPVARCAPSQVCGHVILSFLSPQSANNVLANGLFMCQKKVYAEKCKREPLQCLKCHGWNHMAATCPQQFDICNTCAQQHCTVDCVQLDNPHCVSCDCDGHASWDRACPTFMQKCTELNE